MPRARSVHQPGRPAIDVRDPQACRAVAREAAMRGRLSVWSTTPACSSRARRGTDRRRGRAHPWVGVLHGSRAALERMSDRGRILNVTSLSALGLAPGLAVYAATKHAVLAFGTSLAADLYAAGHPRLPLPAPRPPGLSLLDRVGRGAARVGAGAWESERRGRSPPPGAARGLRPTRPQYGPRRRPPPWRSHHRGFRPASEACPCRRS